MSHQLVQSRATVADTARHRLLAGAVNEHCTPSLHGQRSDRGRGWGGEHNMEKGAWQHVFVLLISTNKCRKSHSSYLVLVNWKLPYVVFGVYYILIPIALVFVGLLCCSMAMWMICDCIFLEKILKIFIHASPNASEIKFDWHCVIRQGIRKKHAKNLRDKYALKSLSSEHFSKPTQKS